MLLRSENGQLQLVNTFFALLLATVKFPGPNQDAAVVNWTAEFVQLSGSGAVGFNLFVRKPGPITMIAANQINMFGVGVGTRSQFGGSLIMNLVWDDVIELRYLGGAGVNFALVRNGFTVFIR